MPELMTMWPVWPMVKTTEKGHEHDRGAFDEGRGGAGGFGQRDGFAGHHGEEYQTEDDAAAEGFKGQAAQVAVENDDEQDRRDCKAHPQQVEHVKRRQAVLDQQKRSRPGEDDRREQPFGVAPVVDIKSGFQNAITPRSWSST